MKKHFLAILAYVLPTFPLGFFWHLTTFADYYKSLEVYREQVLIPFGLASMFLQGILWSILYKRLFAGEPILRGAAKFFLIAMPLAWSFAVLAVAAKNRMSSVSGFVSMETAFYLVQYAIASPLIAWVYTRKD
jgi:hypothetical protein